jgi:hypothetical protein
LVTLPHRIHIPVWLGSEKDVYTYTKTVGIFDRTLTDCAKMPIFNFTCGRSGGLGSFRPERFARGLSVLLVLEALDLEVLGDGQEVGQVLLAHLK